ncbi:MAG TPA: HAMP domain-containing protein, partial [Kofleriaceae bacterium]|nr:HAMP domain-containing protein [Kofleriaceae bacterium]
MIAAEPGPQGGERRSVVRLAVTGDGAGRPELRLKLRTKVVVAMLFAALVPAMIVALLATGVILSSLEAALREDAARQLVVGLNLVLRTIERLGDETVELSESSELGAALASDAALDAWLAHASAHVPSARLQLFGPEGQPRYDRVVWGDEARFDHAKVWPGDPAIASGQQLGRAVSLVAVGERVVVRAVSPIVDSGLTLNGVLVLSMPLDADFADGIKGALSADVMLGGPSGVLETTFRRGLRPRTEVIQLAAADRVAALAGQRVIRNLDVGDGEYLMAATALIDRRDRPIGVLGVAVDRAPLTATKRLAMRSLVAGEVAALAFALVLALFWSRRLGSPIVELHRGAIAVSRGDLDHRIHIPGGDELTDLATAFNQMTSTLQDNQARLAARMREIVALHDAGRAVSSVIDVESVSRKIVDAVARTVEIQLAALWLVEHGADPDAGHAPGALRVTAARARRADVSAVLATDDALAASEALRPIVEAVYASRRPLRLDRASADPAFGDAATRAGAPGPLVALPLDRQTRVVGVLVVGRGERAG